MDDLPNCTFNACNRAVDYHTTIARRFDTRLAREFFPSQAPLTGFHWRSMRLVKVRAALEKAGVEFIDEDGGGPGVRLRKAKRKGKGS
jgi:hypothetical protein